MLYLLWELLYLQHALFFWEPSPTKYKTAMKWGNITHNRKSPEQKICILTRQSIITQRHLCCLNDQWQLSMGQVWYLPRQRNDTELPLPALCKRTHLKEMENKRSKESLYISTQVFGVLSLYRPPKYVRGEHTQKSSSLQKRMEKIYLSLHQANSVEALSLMREEGREEPTNKFCLCK